MDNIIIEKVINNNIISAYEKSGAEVIVMGRGIGFKKKQGEVVPADQISKIFRIKSRTLAEQFKELLHVTTNSKAQNYRTGFLSSAVNVV